MSVGVGVEGGSVVGVGGEGWGRWWWVCRGRVRADGNVVDGRGGGWRRRGRMGRLMQGRHRGVLRRLGGDGNSRITLLNPTITFEVIPKHFGVVIIRRVITVNLRSRRCGIRLYPPGPDLHPRRNSPTMLRSRSPRCMSYHPLAGPQSP